jgi:hypothetical protein
MNRLSPLIVRRVGPSAPPIQWDIYAGEDEPGPDLLESLRLFATGWLGGFVFFFTFLS